MEEKTEMDRGMGQIPPDKHSEILKTAHKYRIDENDPTWILVNLVVESLGGIAKITNEGTKALREASVTVTSATSAEVKASRELAAREITKMQEAAKANIANALGGTLKDEIEKAVNQLKSQSNRPLHKKWGIAMGVAVLVALGLGGWGFRDITTYYEKVGYDSKAALNEKIQKDWPSFVNCRWPGWEIETRNGNEQWCFPFAKDPKTGEVIGWRMR